MMINQIIEAISVAIAEEFGQEYNIYVEQIDQSLEEPCFFIHLVDADHTLYLGNRYHKTNNFDIQYFPNPNNIQFECNDVSERLYNCLEYITLYDADVQENESMPIRSGLMHHEVIDGVLHFMTSYNGFTLKSVEQTEMKALSESVNVDNDD